MKPKNENELAIQKGKEKEDFHLWGSGVSAENSDHEEGWQKVMLKK